jgi:hypothetical protein
MSDLDTNDIGIGELLRGRLLRIPDYQRSYSWEQDEVDDLWRDVTSAMESNAPEYFLGSVVTIRGEAGQRVIVIDGQQRLATVSLLYAAMRDLLAARGDERGTEIERDLLGRRSMSTREQTQNLMLNAEDNDYFRSLTLDTAGSRTVAPTVRSHLRLQSAFETFVRNLAASVDGLGAADWQVPLIGLYTYLLTNARVIDVSVGDEARGFVIFETLNDRGLDLSTADLLKNHLLGSAGPRIEEAKSRWARSVAPFAVPDGRLEVDVFLRQFWASKKGVVRVKALYSQMRGEITNPATAIVFADELLEASPLWIAMFDRDSDVWRPYSSGTLAALDVLRNLNVEQCRPLLLAVLRRFGVPEAQRVFEMVVNWSVRWIVVGGGSAGTTERLYAETAQAVTERTINDASGVATRFEAFVPNDLAFETAFTTFDVSRSWLARYLLTALEGQQIADPEPELVPNENVDQVNLEHVLPKNPDPSWAASFSSDQAQAMVLRLGNQALLRKTHNRRIGNQSFAVKQPILAASDLELTREIGRGTEWTPADIESRQRRMAALAVAAWRRS